MLITENKKFSLLVQFDAWLDFGIWWLTIPEAKVQHAMPTDLQNAPPKRGYIQHTSAGQTLTPCAINWLVSPCKADTWPNPLAIQAQPDQIEFRHECKEVLTAHFTACCLTVIACPTQCHMLG